MIRPRGPSLSAFPVAAVSLLLAACTGSASPGSPTLDGFSLSAGTLSPAFDPEIHAYSAVVPFGTLNLTITPTAAAGHAGSLTLSQDGGAAQTVASGTASASLAVPAHGAQSIVTIVATLGQATASYTVTLVQADDDDATLSGLALTAGTLNPAFSSAVTTYNLTVPSGTTGFKVTPTATQGDVKSITIAQDGGTPGTLTSGAQSSTLKVPAAGVTSVVVLVVVAQNGYDKQTYTLNVTLSGNTDATLQSLSSSAGSLSPAFASATTSYTLAVPVGTFSVTVTPKANNAGVKAIVVAQDGGVPATVASGSASPALIVPAIGSTSSIVVKVTAQDGVASQTYTLVLKQNASNDAALSGLTVSAGALSPAFAAGVSGYAVSVPFGTASVTVLPTAHALAVHSITVAQDGGAAASVPSGTGSPALTVPAVGTTSTIAIVVTAQDGVTRQTYTIALSQQSGADATLSALAISAGTLAPAFASGTLGYAVTVPHGTASVTVTPTATDAKVHSITVSQGVGAGALVASGSASASLAVPAVGATSVISIAVVSPDQANTRTYTVTLSQAASTVSTLSALAVSTGTLQPAFASGVTSYAVTVAQDTSAFTATPTAADAAATIQLKQDGGTAAPIASGSASANLTIPGAGTPTVLTLTVTAQSGAATVYTVTVTRAADTDAKLSALAISAGALTPSFAAGTAAYTAQVPFGTAAVTVRPTASSLKVKSITVSKDGGAAQTVASGAASTPLAVPAVGGSAAIAVKVTAEDSTTTITYTIALSQHAPDTDAALSTLATSLGALSPSFAVDTLGYTLSVPFGSTSFTLTPTAEASTIQSIVVAQGGGAGSPVGSGTASEALGVPAFGTTSGVVVEVTAQSGAKRDYTVVVSQSGRDDSTLSALTDSAGGLTGFAPGTLTYSYPVPYQTDAYTITAATNDPQATLTVNGSPATSGQPVALALSPGPNTATVVVTSADATTHTTYTLTITEGAAPIASIAVSVSSVAVVSGGAPVGFGSALTTASNSVTLTISNGGTAPLDISSATVTSGASDFSITSPPVSPVPNPGSTPMQVRFAPSASGVRTGAITIANSSGNQATFVVNLTGTGVNPASSIVVTGAGGASSLFIGAALQLAAAVSPGDAAQTVTWSSGTPAVATVDPLGVVHGVILGTSLITATATDGSGVTGTLTVTVAPTSVVSFVKQTPASGTATMSASTSAGTISIANTYGSSGNAFKYVNPNYYGTSSNGFLAWPTPISGDFAITATITTNVSNKNNNACGVGIGFTTGFLATDRYAYTLMTNPGTANTIAGVVAPRYVSSSGVVTNDTAHGTAFNVGQGGTATGTPTTVQLVFSRSGSNITLGIAGSALTLPTSTFTDGTTIYGAASVYPAISFNNVTATVSSFVIKDGAGNTLFDSATGGISTQLPTSLTLSASSVTVVKGASVNVTATAIGSGGAVATVSALAADPTVVGVSVTNNTSSSTLALNGLLVGTTNVTVTNNGDSNSSTNTRTLAVNVIDFNASDGYGPITTAYPAPGAGAAYADGELALTFDGPPTLSALGSIDLYKLSDGTLVDRIFFAGESQTVAGVNVAVGSQLARVNANTVYFTPHFGKLAYGTGYYVGISTTAITGVLNNNTFVGFSNLKSVASWSFTTRAAPVFTAISGAATVNVDGSPATTTADFRTLGGALMYLAATPIATATAVAINVAAWTYVELVNYRAATPNLALTITISGPSGNSRGDTAVIRYVNGQGLGNTQTARASFYFAGANLVLQNLTLQNTGVRATVQQAEAMYFDSRGLYTMAANNCSFKSTQDTVQTSGRAWIYNSNIEGNVDFIWGVADATLIEGSDLHVVTDPVNSGKPYSIFVARTGTTGAATIGKGYVLLNSRVSVDSGMIASYGRDAGAGAFYDQVAVVNNVFQGLGTLATGLWDTTTAPISLGDSSYVGWKASGNTGLGAESATTATGTAPNIAGVASEFNTRDRILNRVVTVSGGAPTGFQAAPSTWDTSALATAWGAP